jgi:hypothetical protein
VHQNAIEEAASAYADSQNMLNQVSGRAARRRLETLRANISLLETATSGPMPAPIETPRERREPVADAPAAAAPTRGAESPEALVQALLNAEDLESLMDVAFNLTHVEITTPEDRQFYDAARESNLAFFELEKAMQETFGSGLMDQLGPMAAGQVLGQGALGGASPQAPDVSLGEVSGDRGTITVDAEGQTQELGIIRVDGRWYLDGTADFKAQASQAEAMGVDRTMMLQMARSVGAAVGDLTGRVRAGEFDSAEQVMMAFMQAMQGMQGQAQP